jgi:uncharacterized membrane protein
MEIFWTLLLIVLLLLLIYGGINRKLKKIIASIDHLKAQNRNLNASLTQLNLKREDSLSSAKSLLVENDSLKKDSFDQQEKNTKSDFQSAEIKSSLPSKDIEDKDVLDTQVSSPEEPIIANPEKEDEKEKVIAVSNTMSSLYRKVTDPKLAATSPKVTQAPPKPSWLETFKEKNPDLEKFIGENLINKIGILILVLGISYFVKFAIDKEWINEPARVGIGILCGSILMIIAHKLRAKYSSFSSVIVAGGISIFYFTIFIAFQEYHLFSQTVAFGIMTVITAFSTLVSVSYNRQELAILALIGGLASPFMVSSGEGNYVVFFSYLILLNIGILAVSYFKKWKIVNLVSFVATTLFFATWLFGVIDDGDFPQDNALILSLVFYVIFSISNIINNIKSKGVFNTIERSIILANTFIYFGLGYQILNSTGSAYMSLFTLGFALYNILYASILYRKLGADKTNIYLLIGIALTFVTLVVPLQFEGNHITLFWAAEAVLLFWLSQKSSVQSFKFGAMIVQVLAIVSLVIDWYIYSNTAVSLFIVFNKLFLTGIVVLASLIASRVLLKKEDKITTKYFSLEAFWVRHALSISVLVIAYIIGFLEVNYQSAQYFPLASANAFVLTYHIVYVAIQLYLCRRIKNDFMLRITAIIALVSLVIYLFIIHRLPQNEVLANLGNGTNFSHAFFLHYLQLISLIYFGYVLYKDAFRLFVVPAEALKTIQWAVSISVVILISSEVTTHSVYFLDSTISEPLLGADISDTADISEIEYYYKQELRELKNQVIKIGYPITWGVIAFVFLLIGIKNEWKTVRIIALSLLGLTIMKLFIYDIKDVSETGKIVAFILLGALILIISFVYQKIKKLVIDENAKDENP